jgi:hypothetical protein
MFHTSHAPLETVKILRRAFAAALDNYNVIPGDNVK